MCICSFQPWEHLLHLRLLAGCYLCKSSHIEGAGPLVCYCSIAAQRCLPAAELFHPRRQHCCSLPARECTAGAVTDTGTAAAGSSNRCWQHQICCARRTCRAAPGACCFPGRKRTTAQLAEPIPAVGATQCCVGWPAVPVDTFCAYVAGLSMPPCLPNSGASRGGGANASDSSCVCRPCLCRGSTGPRRASARAGSGSGQCVQAATGTFSACRQGHRPYCTRSSRGATPRGICARHGASGHAAPAACSCRQGPYLLQRVVRSRCAAPWRTHMHAGLAPLRRARYAIHVCRQASGPHPCSISS